MDSLTNMNRLNFVNIEKLNGTNFKDWKQKLMMHLGMMQFDIAFRIPKPAELSDLSSKDERDLFEKWETAHSMSLCTMQNAMEDNIRGGFEDYGLAKDYLAAVEEKYKKSNKAEASACLSTLISAKHDDTSSIREYLLKILNTGNRLNAMKIGIS